MELILWRHAEAEEAAPGEDDDARRLTPRGEKQARQMARWLRERLPKDARIVASPAKRAQMTVRPLDLPAETEPRVGTQANAAALLEAAGWPNANGTVVVVGHQPTLGRVAALLMTEAEADWVIRKGAIWWFSLRMRNGERQTALRAAIEPDLA